MRTTQKISDKFAISLSTICAIHCFFAPSLLILFSSFESIQYNNELIHFLFLLMAVAISFFALILGLKNHKKSSYFLVGIAGLTILILALILGEGILGELGEKLVTLSGSIIVVFAHFKNYQTCIQIECSCHDELNQIA
ncbi:MAG: MerC domain-containing protein [Gammaproteobacteria bacterium]